jgi:uncharacterized protein (TIGR02301 family)
MTGLKIAAMAALLAAAPLPAMAQAAGGSAPGYLPELYRLSEILGAVQFLRDLCGSNEGSLWRDQMQALIDSEEPDASQRARMVDRFNRGYESYRSVYRTCTEAAHLTVDRYMDEGAQIAAEIAARYGK